MAKRKRAKIKRSILRLGMSKANKQQAAGRRTLVSVLKVLVVFCALAAVAGALYFAERYVRLLK